MKTNTTVSTQRRRGVGLPDVRSCSMLDEAFERLAGAGFELPNGFVNHGAMACEALSELGFDDQLDVWSRRFARIPGNGVEPVLSRNFDWRESLGVYRRLPEWIGLFEAEIEGQGWPQAVDGWVPRLLPGLSTALFHGVIRVAHAARAVARADTAPRRAELARALGYWAARFTFGQQSSPDLEIEDDELHRAILDAASDAARFYIASPTVYHLHGVTGAMAVELLAGFLSQPAGAAGLAQVRAEHTLLYEGLRLETDPLDEIVPAGVSENDLAVAAAGSRDPHQVKLVEACRRASSLTGDPLFAVAAEIVTGSLV